MNPWTQETFTLVQKHMLELSGWHMTIEDWQHLTTYEQAVAWFDALAYFKMRNHYRSLDEVPSHHKEGTTIYIRRMDRRLEYRRKSGQWVYSGEILDTLYK